MGGIAIVALLAIAIGGFFASRHRALKRAHSELGGRLQEDIRAGILEWKGYAFGNIDSFADLSEGDVYFQRWESQVSQTHLIVGSLPPCVDFH